MSEHEKHREVLKFIRDEYNIGLVKPYEEALTYALSCMDAMQQKEQRIKELEARIEDLQHQSSVFSERCNKFAAENEALRKEVKSVKLDVSDEFVKAFQNETNPEIREIIRKMKQWREGGQA